ncbi:MAG: replication-relaxation family protein [Chloroflexota bacterium]
MLARRGLAQAEEAVDQLPYGRPARRADAVRQRDVPMLVVSYRLLAYVVRGYDRPVRVVAWERPWIRTLALSQSGRARHVRLPAAATLVQNNRECEQPRGLLLLPDVGTSPVASFRPVLRGLLELRQSSDTDPDEEPLFVVGVATAGDSEARVAAWYSLLQQVAHRAGEHAHRVRVVAWPTSQGSSSGEHRRFHSRAEELFGLVARHPLLTRGQLAVVLGVSEARVGRLELQLQAHGWLRPIQSDLAPLETLGPASGRRNRLALVELTRRGRQEAARRLLLPPAVAARRHGLLGRGGDTRRFLRHLAHTVGANAVFVAIVSAARHVTELGGDDALEDWRSAAACGSGSFRPDGYGCYRRGPRRFGFFLEYDRGTERAHEYAAKIAAYYRYRDRGFAAVDYAGFPSVLVVTTSEAAELRFAHEAYVASEKHLGERIPILLTTIDAMGANQEGVLGPIWRTPGLFGERRLRGYWLPGAPPRGSLAICRRQVTRGAR